MFVPIQDIEGYIRALRHNGTPEDELVKIREKHIAHMPPPPEPKPKKWTHGYTFTDQIKIRLEVKGDRVHFKWSAPFEELHKYMYTGKPIPLAVRVKCLLKAGAPDEYVKNVIKKTECVPFRRFNGGVGRCSQVCWLSFHAQLSLFVWL